MFPPGIYNFKPYMTSGPGETDITKYLKILSAKGFYGHLIYRIIPKISRL